MAAPALVSTLIKQGEAVLRALDEARITVSTALWRYDVEAAEWRLVLVTPLVELEGELAAYERVQRVLLKALTGPDQVRLRQIMLVGQKDPRVRAVRQTVPKTSRRALDSIWSGPDIYVYRSS